MKNASRNIPPASSTAAPASVLPVGAHTLISVTATGTTTTASWGLSAFSLVTPPQWAGSTLSLGGASGNDLVLSRIPEPATSAASFGVVTLLLAVRVRRNRSAAPPRG